MKHEWEHLDVNELQGLYSDYSRELEQRLLHGASWEEVTEVRKEVTELAGALYKRLSPSGVNPTESPQRNHAS